MITRFLNQVPGLRRHMEQGIISIAIIASTSIIKRVPFYNRAIINIIISMSVITPASLIATPGEESGEEKLKGANIILSPTNPGQVQSHHDQHSHHNRHITQNISIIAKNILVSS